MRLVIQRVSECKLRIDSKVHSEIGAGLLALIGIEDRDEKEDIDWLVNKLINLRVFNDEKGIMNLSLQDCNASLMLVSQFTLMASTKKGNRPSYIRASKPETAIPIYEAFVNECKKRIGQPRVSTGVFGADMKISLLNDGPVTILIDSKNKE